MSSDPGVRPFRVIQGGSTFDDAAQATLSELQLVSAIREGNKAVAALFHDRMRPIVDRTLGRLIGARDPDYDDVAQQALIELVLSVGHFRGDCPLDAWASIIVARVAYKLIRRRRKERRLFALDSAELPEVADRTAAGGMMMRSALRRIEKHLKTLDVAKAWTFVLHDVHGYDLDEVSAITGVSRSAAQSRLVRGRRALHERIAKDPELAGLLSEHSLRGPG